MDNDTEKSKNEIRQEAITSTKMEYIEERQKRIEDIQVEHGEKIHSLDVRLNSLDTKMDVLNEKMDNVTGIGKWVLGLLGTGVIGIIVGVITFAFRSNI